MNEEEIKKFLIMDMIVDKLLMKMMNKRELDTESIIENFISHQKFGTELKYNDLEISDAIEDLFE